MHQYKELFDSYMSAWENRSKSYDIMSQKQSDAILGYERVYDTETNDIYKKHIMVLQMNMMAKDINQ